jgi:hypothetical protein
MIFTNPNIRTPRATRVTLRGRFELGFRSGALAISADYMPNAMGLVTVTGSDLALSISAKYDAN